MKLVLGSPHQTYRNKAGEKVSGVTTACGVLAKPFLPPWYASMEYEGILGAMGSGTWTRDSLDAVLPRNKEGKRSWFAVQKRDKSADLGTVAHARIQARMQGEELERDGLGDLWEQATPAVERFFEWVGDRATVHCEHQMVSEKWQVGGTLDHILKNGTADELWDVKTGKPWYDGKPYHEQVAQVAAYAAMYQETTGRPISELYIARVGNTPGDSGTLYQLSWKERQAGLLLFEAALAAFKVKRILDGWSE